MGSEIERKFLLKNHSWREDRLRPPQEMIQGYFPKVPGGPTVRVRIAGDRAFITVKGRGKGAESLVRSEFEYEIPVAEARAMLDEFCGSRIVEKQRSLVPAGNGLVWEIDEYFKLNEGLFTAEIELPSPETPFEKPAWLGDEVSDNKNYTNRSLSRAPYSCWVNGAPPEKKEDN